MANISDRDSETHVIGITDETAIGMQNMLSRWIVFTMQNWKIDDLPEVVDEG